MSIIETTSSYPRVMDGREIALQEAVPADVPLVHAGELSPQVFDVEPTVRSATIDDIPALVRIELRAYADVYGADPKPEVVEGVHKKYEERIDLLGDLVRVIERPDRGVYGVIVCCTTDRDKEDFLKEDRDLTSNETLRDIYSPGKNAYIVNLALLPEYQGKGEHFSLFADAIKLGIELGVDKTYFESRLPGLDRWAGGEWVRRYREKAEKMGIPQPTESELANVYWRLTEIRGGVEKPKDPLLRLYSDLGATPLRLIEDAWKPDSSSRGFGVLCEFELPKKEVADEPTLVSPEQIPEERKGFLRRTVEWINNHKKVSFLGGTAIAGLAYSFTQNSVGEILEGAKESASWAPGAYLGSWALIGAGAAMMLVGAGKKITFKNLLKRPGNELADAYNESALVRAGFKVNAVGALAAAGVVTTAVFMGLPPAAWTAALAPAADFYSTLVTRKLAVDGAEKIKLSAQAE